MHTYTYPLHTLQRKHNVRGTGFLLQTNSMRAPSFRPSKGAVPRGLPAVGSIKAGNGGGRRHEKLILAFCRLVQDNYCVPPWPNSGSRYNSGFLPCIPTVPVLGRKVAKCTWFGLLSFLFVCLYFVWGVSMHVCVSGRNRDIILHTLGISQRLIVTLSCSNDSFSNGTE